MNDFENQALETYRAWKADGVPVDSDVLYDLCALYYNDEVEEMIYDEEAPREPGG